MNGPLSAKLWFFLLANLVVKIHIFHGNIKICSIQNLIYIDSIFIAIVWFYLGISFLSKYRVVPKPAYRDAVFDPNWNVSCRYNTFYAMCVCCHPFFVSCTLQIFIWVCRWMLAIAKRAKVLPYFNLEFTNDPMNLMFCPTPWRWFWYSPGFNSPLCIFSFHPFFYRCNIENIKY